MKVKFKDILYRYFSWILKMVKGFV